MQNKVKSKIIALLVLFFISQAVQACVLTMGYRTSARLPKIQADNDSGLYYDLYHKAATVIGCQLNVIRLPKNRILRDIEYGHIDFYPGLTYTQARAEYSLFVPNGLPSLDVGLTRMGVAEMKGASDFKGKVLLSTLGSTRLQRAEYALAVRSPPELSHALAIEYILDKKVDVYVDELSTIAYRLKDHPRKQELMYHLHCCGGITDLTLGFSRKSVHYREIDNEEYDPDKETTFNNFPKKLEKNSIAYKFYQSLMQLKENGYTRKLYLQYYGFDMKSIEAAVVEKSESNEVSANLDLTNTANR